MSKKSLATVTENDITLQNYMQEISRFPMLQPGEEQELAYKWRDEGDTEAAHKLVTSHLRLVAKVAFSYRGYGLPMGDLISEGNLGLMQAVKKFEPQRGFRLATYAMWWIKASMQEFILKSWSMVKIGTTAAQKKLFFNLKRLKGQIQESDGKSLSVEQIQSISKTLNVSEDDVRTMEQRLSGSDHSLNVTMNDDSEMEWQDTLIDDTASQEETLMNQDESSTRQGLVTNALTILNPRELSIFKARRLQEVPETLEALSDAHGVSRERIRQIENRAFDKIQKEVQTQIENNKMVM